MCLVKDGVGVGVGHALFRGDHIQLQMRRMRRFALIVLGRTRQRSTGLYPLVILPSGVPLDFSCQGRPVSPNVALALARKCGSPGGRSMWANGLTALTLLAEDPGSNQGRSWASFAGTALKRPQDTRESHV